MRLAYCGAPWLGTWTAYLAPGVTGREIRPGVPKVDPTPRSDAAELQLCAAFDVVVPRGSDHLRVATRTLPCSHGALAWWKPALREVWSWFDRAPPTPLAIVLVGLAYLILKSAALQVLVEALIGRKRLFLTGHRGLLVTLSVG